MNPPHPPQTILGVDFDERFFDAAIRRAGGRRLSEVYPPPPETKHADYFLEGYAVELKILELEPLERDEHQKAIARIFTEHQGKGNLVPVEGKNQLRLTGEGSQQFWRIVGKPIQRAFESAEKQLRATNGFLPAPAPTAVLLVNAGALSLDHPTTLFNLAADYRKRYPGIDAVFAFSAIPVPLSGAPSVLFARIDDTGTHHALGDKIDEAIRLELAERTGTACDPVPFDPTLNDLRPVFRVDPNRLRRV